jgi:parvulin-like peptidyl-prolyl isomerase
MTAFDQSLPGVTEPGEISAPTKVGESYAIARLGARYPGEPPAFEQQRESLAESARILNQRRMKMDLLQELKSAGKLEILPAAEKLKEPEFDK